jgi:hypothetical protein
MRENGIAEAFDHALDSNSSFPAAWRDGEWRYRRGPQRGVR